MHVPVPKPFCFPKSILDITRHTAIPRLYYVEEVIQIKIIALVTNWGYIEGTLKV